MLYSKICVFNNYDLNDYSNKHTTIQLVLCIEPRTKMYEKTRNKKRHGSRRKTVMVKSLWSHSGWLGSRVVSVLDSGAEGPGSNRSRDAVG